MDGASSRSIQRHFWINRIKSIIIRFSSSIIVIIEWPEKIRLRALVGEGVEEQIWDMLHTVYFWPKKMSSMRRILATILGAIFRFLKTKSDKTFGPWTGHWKGHIMPGVCYLNMYVSCCRRTFTFQMTGRQKTYYSNDRNHTRTNIFTPSARMTFLMRLWSMRMSSMYTR